ncbi:MAG: hypothetical protein KF775_02955 [Cyclobacteriaceae bacterium]|nr:hypothetical protein [Cyclobacteriaceae bacterium]
MVFDKPSFVLSASDLANHLSCDHLTQLERKVALGEIRKPSYRDPSLDILIQRGKDHEAAYVQFLSKHKSVINLIGKPQAETLEAMKAGKDVIVQASLKDGQWQGIADILVKVNKISNLGDWSYEVQDLLRVSGQTKRERPQPLQRMTYSLLRPSMRKSLH